MKKPKITSGVVAIALFCALFLGVACIIAFGLFNEWLDIPRDSWLDALFTWISAAAAIFIGLIAYRQNEKFKELNDAAEEESKKRQTELLEINNRLIKLEEKKEYAYITFVQGEVTVTNPDKKIRKGEHCYSSGITNEKKVSNDITVFSLFVSNQTSVPIRHFEIRKLEILYADFESGKRKHIISYGVGGFVPSPIMSEGAIVQYLLFAAGVKDLAENLPDGQEINLKIEIEVTSIFGRATNQTFLLRLQPRNAFFTQCDKNTFWNYCYESEPNSQTGEVY